MFERMVCTDDDNPDDLTTLFIPASCAMSGFVIPYFVVSVVRAVKNTIKSMSYAYTTRLAMLTTLPVSLVAQVGELLSEVEQ